MEGCLVTREETIELLMMVQAAFPNYKPPDKTVAVNTWFLMLADYPYQQVQMALKAYIATDTSGFAPSIGQIIDKMQMINSHAEQNEMEAWSLVSKALRNGNYKSREEFEKLPDLVKEAVGSPENIHNWAQSDIKSIESVIQSNFIKSYRLVVNRQKEIQKLPKEIKAMISGNKDCDGKRIEKSQNTMLETKEEQEEERKCIPMPDRLKEKLKL